MEETLHFCLRRREGRTADTSAVSEEAARQALHFHASLPGYAPTPLHRLDRLAAALGVARVYVKDESARFGLNAFKALGGSFAISGCLARRLGLAEEELTYPALLRALEGADPVTFVTATDGNHGRGVAWTARILGQRAVVYMPKGSAQERLENIRAQDAQAEITPYNYDDTVRLAARQAEKNGWIMVQDTAWPGYEEIPTRIMQGYTTLALECARQLEQPPTHLFLQAGVGSFAGAVLGYFTRCLGPNRPVTLIVEPDRADCIYRSALADDGTLRFVTGEMNTMMAGLACGEPCTVSWPILNTYADGFVSCSDGVSARGMRLLGRPLPGDPAVISGESGAVCAGVLAHILDGQHEELRCALGLDGNSRVLLISTEGDTDRANYRRILDME